MNIRSLSKSKASLPKSVKHDQNEANQVNQDHLDHQDNVDSLEHHNNQDDQNKQDSEESQDDQNNQANQIISGQEFVGGTLVKEQEQVEEREIRADSRLKKTGITMIILGIISMIIMMNFSTSGTVNTSEEAAQAIENHISKSLSIGTRLMNVDDQLIGQDYIINHTSTAEDTKIYIWDYAAEDGDYVQVLVNGTPLKDPFMIKNKPVELYVPTEGEVQVVGTRDGGGGITYAVHYSVNGTTYFNGTDVGDSNLYTLIKGNNQ